MGAYLLPLGAVLIWSVNTVVSKLAADSISAAEIGFFRWLVAAVLFTPFVLPSIWRQRADIKPLLPRIVVLGVLGMVIYQSLTYYAAHFTTATHMGIIGSLTPVMVLGLSIAALGQRLTFGAVAGSALSIVGVVVVVTGGQLGTLLAGGANHGDGLMLLAMLAYSVYAILLKRWRMPHVSTVQLLYLQILATVLMLLPLYLATPHVGLSMKNLPLVGFAGIGASMLAPLLWMHAIQRLGPSRSSMFFNLIPLLTALIAAWLLSESLAPYHALGGALTVAGVLLAEWWKAPPARLKAADGSAT